MTDQPEALRLADDLVKWPYERYEAAAELRRLYQLAMDQHTEIYGLRAEARLLKTVMVAAAEEIAAHWDAHCDEEGYGPANLMHRLERGIPAQYGYKAGDFARLQAVNSELFAILKSFSDYVRTEQCATDGAVTYSTTAINHWAFLANDAIIKHGGQP